MDVDSARRARKLATSEFANQELSDNKDVIYQAAPKLATATDRIDAWSRG